MIAVGALLALRTTVRPHGRSPAGFARSRRRRLSTRLTQLAVSWRRA